MHFEDKESTNIEMVDRIWDYRMNEGMTWEFCAAALSMDLGLDICVEEIERGFSTFLNRSGGMKLPLPCPRCGGEVTARRTEDGYNISCGGYPGCDYAIWIEKAASPPMEKREMQIA